MLHLIVSAIHTSSVTYLEAIYDLALHPEIHEELRQEIISVMAQEGGFTKPGLTKMVKMDSFMKESARWHPFLAGKKSNINLSQPRRKF
jgi:cytochrome P450